MEHKHHERGDGVPHLVYRDLFILVRHPLASARTFSLAAASITAHTPHRSGTSKKMDQRPRRRGTASLHWLATIFT